MSQEKTENSNATLGWLKKPYESINRSSPLRAVLLYTLYLFFPVIFLSLLAIIAVQAGTVNIANYSMLGSILTYVAVLLAYKVIYKEWPHKAVSNMQKSDIPFVLICYAVMLIGNMVINLIPSASTAPPANQQALESMFTTGNMLMFGLYTVGVAPLVEEILFRRVFFNGLLPKINGIVVAIINILLFTALHTGGQFFSNPVATLQYMWLSSILVFSYAKTRRLGTSYLLHLLNNGVAFIAMLLSYLLI